MAIESIENENESESERKWEPIYAKIARLHRHHFLANTVTIPQIHTTTSNSQTVLAVASALVWTTLFFRHIFQAAV